MFRFIARRLLWLIPVLFTVTLVTFLLMHAAPGGPWDRDPGRRQIDAATQAKLDHQFGLDKPMWRQFVAYILGDVDDEGQFVCGAICGNLWQNSDACFLRTPIREEVPNMWRM